MTYSREVTHFIVECWGLGFTAEETVRAIKETKQVHVGLATIYRHRHSITAQQIIDELIRKQLRDIAKAEEDEVRMKYRDKLLEKFIPHRIEAYQKTESIERKEVAFKLDSLDSAERTLLNALTRKYIKAANKGESTSIH